LTTDTLSSPSDVPLLRRSLDLWRDLDAEYRAAPTSLPVLYLAGGLMIGRRDSTVITGTLASIEAHKLPHQVLSAHEISARWPVFQPAADEIGVFEETAGYLIPENCIAAHLERAEANGADLRFEEKMISWDLVNGGDGDGDGETSLYRITTSKGSYLTKKLVLSVGAWAPEIYGGMLQGSSSSSASQPVSSALSPLKLHVERRVMYWFEPQQSSTTALKGDGFGDIPIYIWDLGSSCGAFYGFPREKTNSAEYGKDCCAMDEAVGVKVAIHVLGNDNDSGGSDSGNAITEGQGHGRGRGQVECTPDNVDRSVSDVEIDQVLYSIVHVEMNHRTHLLTCVNHRTILIYTLPMLYADEGSTQRSDPSARR
jgi:glycine/D-amino acid oxidase-like deaminating enzyme